MEGAQPLRKSNSNDHLDSAPKESIEESVERKEAEKRMEEAKQERQRRFDAVGKLVGFITDKITEFVNLEYQKKLLTYHGAFNSMDFFRELDTDN